MQILHSVSATNLALGISALLDQPIVKIMIHKFLSGEYICKIDHTLASNVVIVGSIKTNDDLMEILSIIDASKRAGASDITLVAPYIAYGRQDVMQQTFSSIGIEIIAKILNSMSISRLITVDIHATNSLKFFDINVTHITAQDIITHYNNKLLDRVDTIIAPDAGSKQRLGELRLETIFLSKTRIEGKVFMKLNDDVKGKKCLIIDDIFDSGGTMIAARDILEANGASSVYGYVTHFLGHNVLLPMYITDSVGTVVTEEEFLGILSLAPLICNAIKSPL
jgi:ribose-phosphate pyrophosphokinase